MPVDTYARLLDELLQVETQAAEANVDRLQRLVDQIENRRKAQFTL
jgi:hypothetical protein